jgi:hypothetical protein
MNDNVSVTGFTYNKARGYGVLLATCNCCGGKLHLNITRHGYVTFDCESMGEVNRAPCKHARYTGKEAGDWTWKCACPSERLDRDCPNKIETALDERRRIQGLIEAVVYTAAMSRRYVILDLRDSDYIDLEPAIMDAANMSFIIDGVANQRPYFLFVRRFFRANENVSSRFVFFKRGITISIVAAYVKRLLALVARCTRKIRLFEWIQDRYEML